MATTKLDPRPVDLPRSSSGVASKPVADPAVLVKDLERTPQERRGIYLKLPLKLMAVIAIALGWAGFSFWFSLPWIETLGQSITMPLAIAVIFGIAIIPGYLNANLIAS